MEMSTAQQFYTTKEAAEVLGYTDAHIRQICIDNENIGKKHGFAWLLTEADLVRIENLPDRRKKTG